MLENFNRINFKNQISGRVLGFDFENNNKIALISCGLHSVRIQKRKRTKYVLAKFKNLEYLKLTSKIKLSWLSDLSYT